MSYLKLNTAFASIVNRAGLLCSADNLNVMSTADQNKQRRFNINPSLIHL